MMLNLQLALLLLFTTEIGPEPKIEQHYRNGLVCEDISAEIENREIACQIEFELLSEGLEPPMIEAVLLNSYAESRFNPMAVGDSGRSVGVFQLNINGLGHHMTKDERHDIRKSARRLAGAIRKSKRIKDASDRGAETGELTRLVCTEIMRPSNKHTKARAREALRDKLFVESSSKRGILRSQVTES
jgi:hypothetical protein